MGIASKMGHVGYSNEWPISPAMPISPHPILVEVNELENFLFSQRVYLLITNSE